MRRFCQNVVSVGVLLSTGVAVAAEPSIANAPTAVVNAVQNLSNFYDPGRISNQVQQTMPRMDKYAPSAKVTPPKQDAGNASDKINFKLTRVIIKGNTIFPKRVFCQTFIFSHKLWGHGFL